MKYCKECQALVVGRSDKLFCGDSCRSAYNNRTRKKSRSVFGHINRTLRSNREILRDLERLKKRKLPRSQLQSLGFSFDFFTHITKDRHGHVMRFCYDCGYVDLNGEITILTFDDDRLL